MGQYFFDPEDYDVGDGVAELPFTLLRGTETTFEIELDGSGNKRLKIEGAAGTHWTFDDVPDALEVESYMRLEAAASLGSSAYFGLFSYRLNAAGTDGYGFALVGSDDVRLLDPSGSAESGVTGVGEVWAASDMLEVRRRIEDSGSDTLHQARVWHDGTAEPGTWGASITDNTYQTAGATGVGYHTRIYYVYAFGVGTDGDSAPTEAVVEPADREITAALTLAGPTVAAEAEVKNEVAAALQLAGPTLSAEAKVLSELTAALELAGPTLEAEVFTTPIRVLSAALVLAGPTISAEAAVQNDLEAALELAGPTVAVDAAVVAKVEAALELAGPTIAAEVSPQDLNTLAAALQLAPPEISAELSRPPRLARLILTLTDAINLNLTLED